MPEAKKLIEVALPIKEISFESVRDKSIRHGHISTLHLWWARRPLPVCRAVVFASLVPDPLDENCPQQFKEAARALLGKQIDGTDPYQPYKTIPYTSALDTVDDNLRNRLLMFIGKFSVLFCENELKNKSTSPKDTLSNYSLIKWDNKNNEKILNIARKLIWVAHAPEKNTLSQFDSYYLAIKNAEKSLYDLPNRHLDSPENKEKEEALHQAIQAFQDRMPSVFDPFAGGGAIPLEAARLGCRSYGNDLNPVAHIIQKGSLEFPQKFGKPIVYSKEAFIKKYGKEEYENQRANNPFTNNGNTVSIENRLAYDVDYYAQKLLKLTEDEIGHYYPANEKGEKPVAYYWARVGTCSNPSCQAKVPLLRGFYLVNKPDKKLYLYPTIRDKDILFEIKKGECTLNGWMTGKSLICPCCGSTTEVSILKKQSITGKLEQRLLAVIEEGSGQKNYRLPKEEELKMGEIDNSLLNDFQLPNEFMEKCPDLVSGRGWGIDRWRDLFSSRQLLAMQTLVNNLKIIKEELQPDKDDFNKAVVTYLGILIDRIAVINTAFGRLNVKRETLEHPFSRQAIPFIFDYPESNPFCYSTGSAKNHIDWICRYIYSESNYPFNSICNNAASGDVTQFKPKSISCVVTDPPYYDAIAYADLSDFFYVWLKRTLADIYPFNLSTPQSPKTEECTALKHHHENSAEKAKKHFEDKLLQIFSVIEQQTQGIISIMFAHQSTEAWTTLCNSILNARMNIFGSWSIDTEMASRTISLAGAALASSVTVACKPSKKIGIGYYSEIKKAIYAKVMEEVEVLYKLGFRGADLLTSCFGQAVSVYGEFEKVEKADGSEVSVSELLEMTREAAFNALIKGFVGDDFTKFYIAWMQLYGFTESNFDDAAKFSRVGLSINVSELFAKHILIKHANKQVLATMADRIALDAHLGNRKDSYLIDKVHRAMFLFLGANRKSLLDYIAEEGSEPEGSFWRVINSLYEVLPNDISDYKCIVGLIGNKDSLIRDSKHVHEEQIKQTDLF